MIKSVLKREAKEREKDGSKMAWTVLFCTSLPKTLRMGSTNLYCVKILMKRSWGWMEYTSSLTIHQIHLPAQSTSPSISCSRSSSFSSSRSHTQFKSLSRSNFLSFSSSCGQSHSSSRPLSRPRYLSRSSSHGHSRSPPRSLSSSLSKSSVLSLVSSH